MEIMLIIGKKSSDNDNLEMFPLHYRYFCIFLIICYLMQLQQIPRTMDEVC